MEIRTGFTGACRAAGSESLTFHDLRHTAATRVAEAGAHIVDIKAVLGHAPGTMTARYAHASDEGCAARSRRFRMGPGTTWSHSKKGGPGVGTRTVL